MAEKKLNVRRIIACLLIGVGVFLVVVAIMLPTYTKSKAMKTPLDLHVHTVAEGTGSVLDAQSLVAGAPDVAHGVEIEALRNVTVQDPANADVITVQAGTRLLRMDKPAPSGDEPTASDPRLINATVDRVTLDRVSSMPINDPDSPNGVQTDPGGQMKPVPRDGLQYKFPFNVQKKSYPYFDLTSETTNPIDFQGTEKIDGLEVYHFSQEIGPIDLSETVGGTTDSLNIPAAALGIPGDDEVNVHRYYTNVRNLWVDPITGVVVKGAEQIGQYFAQEPNSDVRIIALQMDADAPLTFSQDTIDYQLKQARDGQDKITLLTFTIPLIAGIVGALLIIVGLGLGFTQIGRKGSGDGGDNEGAPLATGAAPGAVGPGAPHSYDAHEAYGDLGGDDPPTQQL